MANYSLTQANLLTDPALWLDIVKGEYLEGFIADGGSAVKVVSGTQQTLRQVSGSLAKLADAGDYHFVSLDPTSLTADGRKPDLHRIDRLFFAVSETLDWKSLAMTQAYRYLAKSGISVEGHTLDDLDGIAAANGRDTADLLNQYQRELATPQIKDYGMAVDFRNAITALGRAQLTSASLSSTCEETLLKWLVGKTEPGASAALKKIHIFERINQSNARQYLASLCRWLPNAGRAGLVLVLDMRAYENKKISKTQRLQEENRAMRSAIARGASQAELVALVAEDETPLDIAYSDSAFVQMLTLIRHFIDEIDWFERFLLVVLTSPGFYDASRSRNYNNYDALQTRIGLEVHDARRANPCASLVHLGATQ